MNALTRLYRTTIGKKLIMAVTGIVMALYVLLHMIGNLQIFQGRDAINEYGLFLRRGLDGEMLKILWIVRGALLASLILHVWMFVQLLNNAESARPVGYRQLKPRGSDIASRTMRFGGIALFLYIALHLLQHTFGVVGFTAEQPFDEHDVYNNLVISFQQPVFTAVYIAALIALGLHLYHGTWSVFQTFGCNHPAWNAIVRRSTAAVSVLIVVGFMSVPIAIQTGMIKKAEGKWPIPEYWQRGHGHAPHAETPPPAPSSSPLVGDDGPASASAASAADPR